MALPTSAIAAAVYCCKLSRGCRYGNQEVYRRLRLVPRVMRDVSNVDMATTMLGKKMAFPVYISGAAKGGLGHQDAEVALCKAAASYDTLQMCPHMATKVCFVAKQWRCVTLLLTFNVVHAAAAAFVYITSRALQVSAFYLAVAGPDTVKLDMSVCVVQTLEQMAEARADGQSQFLQLYVEKDRKASEEMVKRADKLGFSGLFLTVRGPVFGVAVAVAVGVVVCK